MRGGDSPPGLALGPLAPRPARRGIRYEISARRAARLPLTMHVSPFPDLESGPPGREPWGRGGASGRRFASRPAAATGDQETADQDATGTGDLPRCTMHRCWDPACSVAAASDTELHVPSGVPDAPAGQVPLPGSAWQAGS